MTNLAQRYNVPFTTAFDTTGVVSPGAQLFFYQTGTSTPLNTYSDAGLTIANANPVVANGAGLFPNIFLIPGQAYKVVLEDSNSNIIWTADPVYSAPGGAASPYWFITTTALLAAFPASITLANGTIAFTAGRTAQGDGGGTEFYYNSSDTTTADNGGSIRVDGQGRRWYAINAISSGILNVKLFGAAGDGSTDDTTAIKNAMTAAAALGANGSAVSFPPGNYIISSKLSFVCSMFGCANEAVTISASAGFSGGYMLDFNAGQPSQTISEIAWNLKPLGTSGTATAFGSSTALGGGGKAFHLFNHVAIASSSLGTPALQMASTGSEAGALTGSVWNNLYVGAPMPANIGANQDDIVFNSPRFNTTGGSVTGVPNTFLGSDLVLNAPYFGIGGDTPGGINAIVNVGPLPVIINGGLMETGGAVTLTNAIWGFELISSGLDSAPEAHFQINNMELNVAYGGASADQAFIRVNTPSGSGNFVHVNINGLTKSSGGNAAWNTLFDIFNSHATPTSYIYITINDCDEIPNISMAAAGSTGSGGVTAAYLKGWYRGAILNHTGAAPAAGTRYSWVWVVGANFGPA